MTLDDLIAAYNSGYWSCYEEQHRAGIRAVVEEFRDVIAAAYNDAVQDGERFRTSGEAYAGEVINDILGGAVDQAAGGPTREDGQGGVEQAVPAVTPAADPSPAVCEWTQRADGLWFIPCDFRADMRGSKTHCPHCLKPIVFKEPKP